MPDGSKPTARRDLSQMQRVFVPLESKSAVETAAAWVIRGTATTPRVDRMGDIVRPLGAQFDRAHMPKLMLYHDSTKPVGTLTEANVKASGITFAARIPKVLEAGVVRDRIEEAVHSVKYDLVSYTSIGFNPIDYEPIDKDAPDARWFGPFDFKTWEWLELSLVTIPAQPDAVITGIKSIDDALRNARARRKHFDMGREAVPGRITSSQSNQPAGAPAQTSKGNTMQSLQEQVAGLDESRKTKSARMQELADFKKTETRGFSTDERTEFDALATEIQDIDDDLKVKRIQLRESASAVEVETPGKGRAPYGFVRGKDVDEKFKGQNFTRMVIARALASRDEYGRSAATIAAMRWGKTNPTLVAIMKANEVPGGGSGSGEWGAELVTADTRYTGDFIEYLYSLTVFDRLPLREIPANVMVKGQDGVATGYWVGESKAIPATTDDFFNVSLTPLKVAALAVVSNEWIADASLAGELLVRDALGQASSQRVDTTFLSATAASSGVSPAGLINGLAAATAATGADGMSLRQDIRTAYTAFFTAKNATGVQLVMSPSQAKSIGLMVNALGNTEFPGLTQAGGNLLGDPVVTGDNVVSEAIYLIKPSDIYKIGDSGIQVSISRDATIEQSTAPIGATDTPVAMTQAFTSMFQEESTAIKVVRRINFAKRRTSAVAWISGAQYGNESS